MSDQEQLIRGFLDACADEDAKVGKALGKLGNDAQAVLGTVLSRFDYSHTGTLDQAERVLARRVLSYMHRPSGKGLEALLSVLDYLDVNDNQKLDHAELTLAVEILEMFCKADSVNGTLSTRELEMLLAVLRSMDPAGKGSLDEAARVKLRDSLWDPDEFLAQEKQNNAELKALLEK